MKFDDLDKELRVYETNNDLCVLPGIYMVARIDGRSFTKLTKENHDFEAPYDERFRDHMTSTAEHLMTCGFRVIYGYTQSDEISLLFHPEESSFGRKLRKFNSVLAGEASAKFSVVLGDIGAFDCRISQLPTQRKVIDYFRWRNEDAHRNALNAYCYWSMRKQGMSAKEADHKLKGQSVAAKNELLFSQFGINFNEVPNWQKRGIGLYWGEKETEGFNPITQQTETARRRAIIVDHELPMRDEYSQFVDDLVNSSN